MIDPMPSNPEPRPELDFMLEEALALHGQGALEPAEAMYRHILALEPHHFTAMHCLGSLRNQCGDYEVAAKILGEALQINPRSALAHFNLGVALWNLHRPEEALAHYQYSLILQPGNANALMNRATALQALGRQEEALASLDKFLTLQPDAPEGHLNRGIVLQGLLRLDEALASLDLAIALKPDLAEAHMARGNVLFARWTACCCHDSKADP